MAANPFGNLGERDWGASFWLAALVFAATYFLMKVAAGLLGSIDFLPAVWLAIGVGLLGNPMAAALGETVYHWRVAAPTYGAQRALLCVLGTVAWPLAGLVLGDSVLSFCYDWVVAAGFAGFWLFVLDKVRAKPSFFD